MAVVLVFLQVGGDLLLFCLPGFVFIINIVVEVGGDRDAVEFEDFPCVFVAAVDEEFVSEDFLVSTYLNAEWVHEHVFEGEDVGWFEELALQHA